MPDFSPGGVQFPVATDAPRRQDLEDLARSIDDPQGLSILGKFRRLANVSGQSFANSASLTGSTITGWSASGGDQGDATGITLSGGILTVTEAGIYFISVMICFTANATGQRRVIALPGALSSRSSTVQTTSTASVVATAGPVVDMVPLNAGDTITTQAAQNSGGALTLNAGSTTNLFVVGKLRAF